MVHFKRQISSPVGRLTWVATQGALCAVLWEDDDPKRVPLETAQPRTSTRKELFHAAD